MFGERAPRLAGLLVGLWAVWATGCGAHRPSVEGATLPKRTATLPQLEQLFAERAVVGAYRALVTLGLEQGRREASIRGVLSFTPPRTFVVRGLDPLGRDLFTLSAEGEDVRLDRPGQGPALIGTEAIEAGLAPWTGAVRMADLLRVLGAGQGRSIDPVDVVALERGEEWYTLYVLILHDGRARLERKIRLERTRFLPAVEEWFDGDGSRRAQIRFDRYEYVGGHWQPFLVTAQGEGGTLTLRIHEFSPGGL